jgi:hypothetical protein
MSSYTILYSPNASQRYSIDLCNLLNFADSVFKKARLQ